MNSSEFPANVVDLSVFKRNKDQQDILSRGRTPLHVSHIDGKVKGSPHFRSPDSEDFGDRMQRIKTSLEKINQLMAELKKSTKKSEL